MSMTKNFYFDEINSYDEWLDNQVISPNYFPEMDEDEFEQVFLEELFKNDPNEVW